MYDLIGSLSVFGFLTVYALVALALPFARRALGQHSHVVAIVSVFTVVVMILIAVFDLQILVRCGSRADSVYLSRLYCRRNWLVCPAAQKDSCSSRIDALTAAGPCRAAAKSRVQGPLRRNFGRLLPAHSMSVTATSGTILRLPREKQPATSAGKA